MIETILLGIVILALIVTVGGDLLIRRLRRPFRPDPNVISLARFYERATLRVYTNGQMTIGPISLYDLAMIIQYGGYREAGERSILHIPSDPGVIHPSLDITVEVIGDDPH